MLFAVTNGLEFALLIQTEVSLAWNVLNVVCFRDFIFIPYCQVKEMKFTPVIVVENFSQLQNEGHDVSGAEYYTKISNQRVNLTPKNRRKLP